MPDIGAILSHSVFETFRLPLMWMDWHQNLYQMLSPRECECLSCGGLSITQVRSELRSKIEDPGSFPSP